jgi:hypothetical protein
VVATALVLGCAGLAWAATLPSQERCPTLASVPVLGAACVTPEPLPTAVAQGPASTAVPTTASTAAGTGGGAPGASAGGGNAGGGSAATATAQARARATQTAAAAATATAQAKAAQDAAATATALALAITPEDCLTYDPAALRTVANPSASTWLLEAGNVLLLQLASQADAAAADALARQHTAVCFIGRPNKQTNQGSSIVQYWKPMPGPGGTNTVPNSTCMTYDPKGLQIATRGASGWLLTDGTAWMPLALNTQQDAQNAFKLASQNNRLCIIGRDNTRPNHDDYIVRYWLQAS